MVEKKVKIQEILRELVKFKLCFHFCHIRHFGIKKLAGPS